MGLSPSVDTTEGFCVGTQSIGASVVTPRKNAHHLMCRSSITSTSTITNLKSLKEAVDQTVTILEGI